MFKKNVINYTLLIFAISITAYSKSDIILSSSIRKPITIKVVLQKDQETIEKNVPLFLNAKKIVGNYNHIKLKMLDKETDADIYGDTLVTIEEVREKPVVSINEIETI